MQALRNICEIGKERIRRAGEKIKAEIEEQNAQLKIGEEPRKVPDIGFQGVQAGQLQPETVAAGL